jgi:hypothetical protein
VSIFKKDKDHLPRSTVIISMTKFDTMKKFDISSESLMTLFDKRNQITWLELLNIIFQREASMFEKCALAKALEVLQSKSWIERVAGDTVQWTITESGRYQISHYRTSNEAFGYIGQTPN